MRVVHIINGLGTGGAEMMLLKLVSHTDRKRFESIIVSLRDYGGLRSKFKDMGVPVYTLGMRPSLATPRCIWRLAKTIRRLNPDLIQGWMYHSNLAAQLAGSLQPKPTPVLWNVRGSHYVLKEQKPQTAAIIWLSGKLSALPAKIINNSTVSAINHHRRLSYRADRQVIIPNGFDTLTFVPSLEARQSVRSELRLADDAVLIGLIARYDGMKDHANFLRAASLLVKTNSDVHFLLAGNGVDQNNEALTRMIRNQPFSDRLHLLGERSDIPRLTAALDIATSSSAHSEGFSNTIGEAMSCGVPCVATDVGDSAFIVGDTGRIVPPRDEEALAKAWGDLLNLGQERLRELGAMARQQVIEKFSLDAVVHQYEILYEQVLSESRVQSEPRNSSSILSLMNGR